MSRIGAAVFAVQILFSVALLWIVWTALFIACTTPDV